MKEFPRIYGVLMDWPMGEQIATVFSSSTGAASLYTTSAFGIVGGEGHETVRIVAKDFVRAADKYFEAAAPTSEYPYPTANRVYFYLLTYDGVRVIDADVTSINGRTSEYTGLFELGQAVITALRCVSGTRE
jgi:hypothetical protein